ncbi:hemin-degrading factor [Azospirillum doebereinerae]|uniref:Hemin-degrading factor n=1 Tax=Azospirillum doebereinerae TaxID=92933 RepID=A0A3S0V406_9PROT|nr:ChuX/HutX family heme-like substrate-binding protein [Azospirillum doebereinerae]MCG5243802.1 hemin-degrading factor [Azospirillum doebereinerae]RUQ66338.1 hemin-degrading factor [Azospirillum doebereinerae]
MSDRSSDLLARIEALRAAEPRLRARDLAQRLGVSEAEFVAAGCGRSATRLRPDWAELLRALEPLGEVMALTRNDSAVHERHGIYRNVQIHGMQALVLDEDIDLRIFLGRWHHGFAVAEGAAEQPRRSLQIFDVDGTAVHKIYVTGKTDAQAYAALVAAFRAGDQSPALTVTPKADAGTGDGVADDQIDVPAFRAAWDGLQDTHDFFPLLRRFKLARTQALRLGGEGRAEAIPVDAPRRVLELASARGTPIMVFVGSPGVIQIHTGPVVRIEPAGPWINVLDPAFNLHLREDAVTDAWIVRKPTQDGTVTSVEVFDGAGNTIALFFGKRKPGQPEDPAWRDLVAALALARDAA